MSAWLICETGHWTDRLWFGWCAACWYCKCGGDLASDDNLARPPTVWLSAAVSPSPKENG